MQVEKNISNKRERANAEAQRTMEMKWYVEARRYSEHRTRGTMGTESRSYNSLVPQHFARRKPSISLHMQVMYPESGQNKTLSSLISVTSTSSQPVKRLMPTANVDSYYSWMGESANETVVFIIITDKIIISPHILALEARQLILGVLLQNTEVLG